MLEKMKELLTDEAFVTKLLSSSNLDEAMACLKTAGVECTAEEAATMLRVMVARVNERSMDMDAMDAVAGGAEHETTLLGDMGRQIGTMVINTFSSFAVPKGLMIANSLTEQIGHVTNTITNAILGEKEPEWSRWYNPAIDGPNAGTQEGQQ